MDYYELAELALMFLDPGYKSLLFHKPGPVHHARFMGKALYYLKLVLLLNQTREKLDLSEARVEEIIKMSIFIAIFYTPKFLTAEKSDIAAIQVKSHNEQNLYHIYFQCFFLSKLLSFILAGSTIYLANGPF